MIANLIYELGRGSSAPMMRSRISSPFEISFALHGISAKNSAPCFRAFVALT